MSKVGLAIELDSELRDQFNESARFEHRPAAQVLRELMRSYVDTVGARMRDRVPAQAVDAAERERRREAVRFARTSVGLEGFTPSEDAEALAAQFVDGQIELPALLSGLKERVQ